MRNTVNANEFGGHTLPDLGVVVRFAEDRQTGMGMEIDKAGADNVVFGIDHSFSLIFIGANFTSLDRQRVVVDQYRAAKPG